MKKRIVFGMEVLALLCFAMPAVAGPPEGIPAVSAGYFAQEAAPVVVVGPAFQAEAPAYTMQTFQDLCYIVFTIATAAMLVGLMRSAKSGSNRLSKTHYNPRDRLQALARDQTTALG